MEKEKPEELKKEEPQIPEDGAIKETEKAIGNTQAENSTDNKTEKGKSIRSFIAAAARQITDEKISITSSTAMALFIMSAALMACFAIRKKSIDYIMNTYPDIIKYFVLPLMAVMIFAVYLMVIGKIIADGKSILKTVKNNPVFIIFSLAVILMIYSQYYNGLEYALSGYCSASLAETFPMEMIYFVFVLFGATQVRKEVHKRFLIRMQTVVSAILVLAAFLLWHTMVESSFFYDWTPRFSSIFSNTNYYTYYLAVSIPLAAAAFLYEKSLSWKIISGGSFIANSIALSINSCMGGWAGASFAMIFIVIAHFIIEKKLNRQALVLIVVFVLCMFIPSHVLGSFEGEMSQLGDDVFNVFTGNEAAVNAGSGRIRLWKQSLEVANQNSMLGIGFEGIAYWGFKGSPDHIRPHNEFIQYALFHGYPMMILYFIGCFCIFLRALRKKEVMSGATLVSLSAAFGYLVSSFFGMTLFSTAAYLFIFLGMGYVRDEC